MQSRTEKLIIEYIDDIDTGDFAKVFFEAIREAYAYLEADIVFDLYRALSLIGITDQDIKNSKSNDLALCRQFENIYTSISSNGVLEVLAAWELVDSTDYSGICLYLFNDELQFKLIDDTIKNAVTKITVDGLRKMFIERFRTNPVWF